MSLPYPPPFMDLRTLAEHVCASERAIENWVKMGEFPKPKMQGGKRLWEWRKVQRHLAMTDDAAPNVASKAEEIAHATRKALAGS